MYPLFFYLCVGLYHPGINHLSFSRGSLRAHTIRNFFIWSWRYTYSIRLFLIGAKHRYKGKNVNRKHTLKIYKVQKVTLFHSALTHQALAGSAPLLSTKGTSVLPQQTMKPLLFG